MASSRFAGEVGKTGDPMAALTKVVYQLSRHSFVRGP
jgi:hypothetical protein